MVYEEDNENDGVGYEGGSPGGGKGSMERMSLGDVETLDIDPATGTATDEEDDDADLNYYNDDLSD